MRFFHRICTALIFFAVVLFYPCGFVCAIGWEGPYSTAFEEEVVSAPPIATEEPDTSSERWWNAFDFDSYGFVRGEIHVPAFAGDDSKNSFGSSETYFGITTELKASAYFTHAASAFVDLRYRTKSLAQHGDSESYVGHNAEREFDVREGYFRFRGDWLDVTAGQQIISWGVADGINPTDKLCPKNMTIVSSDRDDRRLGILALKGDLYVGDYTITGVWQPIFVDSKFRLSRFPEEAVVTVEDPQLPAKTLSNSTVALKCSTSFRATDASLSYFYGWDSFPDIILDKAIMGSETTEVWVKPVYNRIHSIGADFSSVLGPVILRGEGACNIIKNKSGKSLGRTKSNAKWIVGLESECFEDFIVNAQYGMIHVLDYESIPDDESEIENDPQAGVDAFNARLHRQLNRHTPLMTLRLDYWLLQDTLFLEFRGLYYITDEELRLTPRIVYDVTDHLEATIAAKFSFGPAGSRYHRSGENFNEVFTEWKISF